MGNPANSIVAYYRVSTETQGINGLGMEAQRRAVASYAEGRGFPIVASYQEVESGRRDHLRNRPELVKAVAHARRSSALLVIARFDRLARNVYVTSQLLESGVEFIACDNPHANRMTIQIIAVMAEQEGRLISERTKAGLAAARARGVVFSPGHDFTPEERRRGQLEAVRARIARTKERYADLVPLVHELRANSYSLLRVAARLNELGHHTQKGGAWTSSTVQAFLSREKMPSLPMALRVPGTISESVRAKGVIASREVLRLRVKAAILGAINTIIGIKTDGKSWSAVVREVNALGYRNSEGSAWTHTTLLFALRREGLVPPKAPRHGVRFSQAIVIERRRKALARCAPYLELVERLSNLGQTPTEIAEALNEYGYLPPRMARWTRTGVTLLLHRARRWRLSTISTSPQTYN